MKQTRNIMGMPITIEIVDLDINESDFEKVFHSFHKVDKTFSTYKANSEMMKINRGEISEEDYSDDMKEILKLSKETSAKTNGYFNIKREDNTLEPAGIVKGWSIKKASDLLKSFGYKNFYINAGGDIQVSGKNKNGKDWSVGIQNPFNQSQIIKKLHINNKGIATSGTYKRGNHIYNPFNRLKVNNDIVSLTVIGPDIYEADRFATPAFAMGVNGIKFIESLEGFDGYMIDKKGIATYTSNFNLYL